MYKIMAVLQVFLKNCWVLDKICTVKGKTELLFSKKTFCFIIFEIIKFALQMASLC